MSLNLKFFEPHRENDIAPGSRAVLFYGLVMTVCSLEKKICGSIWIGFCLFTFGYWVDDCLTASKSVIQKYIALVVLESQICLFNWIMQSLFQIFEGLLSLLTIGLLFSCNYLDGVGCCLKFKSRLAKKREDDEKALFWFLWAIYTAN